MCFKCKKFEPFLEATKFTHPKFVEVFL